MHFATRLAAHLRWLLQGHERNLCSSLSAAACCFSRCTSLRSSAAVLVGAASGAAAGHPRLPALSSQAARAPAACSIQSLMSSVHNSVAREASRQARANPAAQRRDLTIDRDVPVCASKSHLSLFQKDPVHACAHTQCPTGAVTTKTDRQAAVVSMGAQAGMSYLR